MDYQKTLNLPQTDFPMKANLSKREPQMVEKWLENDLYGTIRKSKKGEPKFILHDGPPYANGNIHLGHALNKILKDIIIKIKSMEGFDSPYIPGWDCHGLPIEHQVVKKLGKKARETPRHEIRSLCREYAAGFVDIQKKEFQRLGVLGDFDNPYLTMSHEYEAGIVEIFGRLFEKGYIYRGKKPIHWSPTSVTALAEAEIEYQKIESPSVYVKFAIDPGSLPVDQPNRDNTFVVIWTTTPWTLPANLAVCFHPEFSYVSYGAGKENYIIAEGLAENFFDKLQRKALSNHPMAKETLSAMRVFHPFIDRESKVIFGRHVTLESGTGIVHTAPGHGQEDYEIGLEYELEIYCPVDRYGRFTDDFPEMKGMKVFDANPKIIDLLSERGMLLLHEKITHPYPHGWRDKKPVIFRATEQWFLKIDHEDLRNKGLGAIKSTKWNPSWGLNRIQAMVEMRPDWCLSRQRAWGVPIPAFTLLETGETVMSKETIDFFTEIIRKEGLDSWFTKEPHELLPDEVNCNGKVYKGDERIGKFKQEEDILDVWFDSGVSSFAVLNHRKELQWPADIYLEGSDQHRGWFQSSLWPAVALEGVAPYKHVITHGFTLDEKGQAMSKSVGNTIAPEKIIEKFGVDILRLWVASENYQNDIKLGWTMMGQVADSYRKIRNSFRYLLGNLFDFNPGDRINYENLEALDKWALYKLHNLSQSVRRAYDQEEFHLVFHLLNNFFISDMSNVYFDISKDMLYCDSKSSHRRRSIQTALDEILRTVVRLIAPILCFTAEEIYLGNNPQRESIHLEAFWDLPDEYLSSESALEIEKLLTIRSEVQKVLEGLRESKVIGKSLEGAITLYSENPEVGNLLSKYQGMLKEFFIVSRVDLADGILPASVQAEDIYISALKAEGEKCPRCWFIDEEMAKKNQPVCSRCQKVLEGSGVS